MKAIESLQNFLIFDKNLQLKIYNGMYLPSSSATDRMWHKVNFKRSTTGLNSEFSFSSIDCHSMVKNPVCSHYLSLTG